MVRSSLWPLLAVSGWLLLTTTGCIVSRNLYDEEVLRSRQLTAEVNALQDSLAVLQDSLQFYDDIDSGQYAREMRVLRDRITALEFDLAVAYDGGRLAAMLLADDLFAPASATLTSQGRQHLDALALTLQDDFSDAAFRVEGHSDNVPLGPGLLDRYPSNWELSAARAAAVVRYLTETQEMSADRFSVVGYSDTRPVASNTTAQGRLQNRRVQVYALPASNGTED